MKNQYVGDVGDFGKYGLLRRLANSGFDVGVNFYLTPDDDSSDGSFTDYLADDRFRLYDPILFEALKDIAFEPDKTVQDVEKSGVLDGVRFYDAPMEFSARNPDDRAAGRIAWHQDALSKLTSPGLVFLDPDNGLSTQCGPGHKDVDKYVMPYEIADYFRRGQNVLYYQHHSRANASAWLAAKRMMSVFLPEARLLALSYRLWNSRCYIFVVHEEDYERYADFKETLLQSTWGGRGLAPRRAFADEEV